MEPLRLRVQLAKRGKARYVSHVEFSRTLVMAARRAGLPLQYAGKYRPRMRISLSPPLPIGVTSECELVDYFLEQYVSPAEAKVALEKSLPAGIDVVRCRLMGSSAKPVGKLIDTAAYRVELPPDAGLEGDWRKAVEVFLGMEVVSMERVQPRRTRVVDLRPGVHRLEVELGGRGEGVGFLMVLDDGTRGTVKPLEVLKVLAGLAGAPEDSFQKARVHREGLLVRRGERLVSPLELGKGKPAV
ncbi:MAG: TIGR03936 family radical SAM-associated protein [Actinobacteria bacterium]|nr:TIGR03936 family radical SAM-associated protein [Actinomycetota bacterium]